MRRRLSETLPASPYQVGIIDSIAHLLYASDQDHPLLSNVEVMVDNSRRILNELLAERIDVGFITGQPTNLGQDVTIHKLHDEAFVFVCAPQLAPDRAATSIDNWQAINQDSTTYHHFIRLFKRQGLSVRPIFYSTSMELLKEMAIAGEGTALLPRHIIKTALENGQLQIVRTKNIYRPIWAVMRKNQPATGLKRLTAQVNQLLLLGNS